MHFLFQSLQLPKLQIDVEDINMSKMQVIMQQRDIFLRTYCEESKD